MSTIKNLKTMLVCLDLTDIDPNLIDYAAFLSQSLGMDKVIFIHAIQAYDLPDKSSKKFPDLKTDLRQRIEDEINSVVSNHFKKNIETEVITKIEDEDAANMIIDFTRKESVDLALIGQKYGEDRTGHYGHKIAAEALTDLMFIPEEPDLSLDTILCAVDFSKVSEKAFRRCLNISKAVNTKLICYYLYDTQKSYFPATTFKTKGMLEKRIYNRFRKFLAKFGLNPDDVELRIGVSEEFKSQAEKLYEEAEAQDVDLLVVGARGKTSVVTSLLGNVTEGLRKMEKQMPIMIMKNVKTKE
ncbi:MAG: universal stress protein [Bacteroidales bacterium]|nr:universal stress protein [Bacteroidales bacterium]